MVEFAHVGNHCAIDDCNQQDFLPFECAYCKVIVCEEHRRPDDHDCKVGGERDSIYVILCPICGDRLRLPYKVNENTVWSQHVDSGDCNKSLAKKEQ